MGRLPLMRSIIMNVVLQIEYTKYIVDAADAVKVMAILSGATIVDHNYDDDDQAYYNPRKANTVIMSVEPIRLEIRG